MLGASSACSACLTAAVRKYVRNSGGLLTNACEKRHSFLSFPYVCPEPFLVKCSFLCINGAKGYVLRTLPCTETPVSAFQLVLVQSLSWQRMIVVHASCETGAKSVSVPIRFSPKRRRSSWTSCSRAASSSARSAATVGGATPPPLPLPPPPPLLPLRVLCHSDQTHVFSCKASGVETCLLVYLSR